MLRSSFIALVLIGSACGASEALAHSGIIMPAAGLTPSNFFYFFDQFGEILQEAFTFGATNKARLQVRLAAERVAEIDLENRVRGEKSAGTIIAKGRFSNHLKEARIILSEAEDRGEEIEEEILEINNEINGIFENADWLDDFMEEYDDIDESLEIPEEGEDNGE